MGSVESDRAEFLSPAAFDDFPGPVLGLDAGGKTVFANAKGGLLQAALADGATPAIEDLIDQARAGRTESATVILKGERGPLVLDIVALPCVGGGALLLARDLSMERNLRAALVDSRQRYKDLVEVSSDFAWETDQQNRFIFVSPKGALGFTAEQLVGRDPRELALGAAGPVGDASPFLAQHPVEDMEIWLRRADGRSACVVVSALPLRGADGNWRGCRGVCRDITDVRARDSALARATNRERLLTYVTRTIRDEVDVGLMLTTAATAITRAIAATGCRVYRARPEGGFASAAGFGDDADLPPLDDILSRLGDEADAVEIVSPPWRVLANVTRYRHALNGALCLWRDESRPSWTDDERLLVGDVANQIAIANEQLSHHERILTISRTDALTGLNNRRAFFEELARRFARLAREKRAAALIYVDLDNFKLVNDVFGHQRGDEALLAVKDILVNGTRPTDMVARLGGDEFAIWLDGADEAISVMRAKALLEAGLALAPFSGSSDKPLHYSLGIAAYDPDSGETLDDLVARADAAMYAVKRDGKGGYRVAPAAHGGGA